jgi:HK97 family phage prohead protease
MRGHLSREFAADLEIRSDGSGRTIHGIVVPFGVTARVSDDGHRSYDEMFQRGAFTKTLKEQRQPVRLLSHHNSTRPIGVATEMREDGPGLYGAFKVSKTRDGDDQLEMARDGVFGGFSVGFTPVKHVVENEVTVRTEVGLRETSLVTFPAYADAMIAGVRASDVADIVTDWSAEERAELARLLTAATPLEPVQEGTPDVGAAAAEPPDGHSARQYTPQEIRTMIRLRIETRNIHEPT